MKALIQDEYRQTLKSLGVVENFVRINVVNGAPGATFVGAATCKDCHPNTFDKWSTTKHAKAFEALLTTPSPTRHLTPNALPATPPASNTTRAGSLQKETP